MSRGYYRSSTLVTTFRKMETKRRILGPNMNEIYNGLRAFHRRNTQSWLLYLAHYYGQFHVLTNFYRPMFHRRWRFQLYCADLKTMTLLKNVLITPGSELGDMTKKMNHVTPHSIAMLTTSLILLSLLLVLQIGVGPDSHLCLSKKYKNS